MAKLVKIRYEKDEKTTVKYVKRVDRSGLAAGASPARSNSRLFISFILPSSPPSLSLLPKNLSDRVELACFEFFYVSLD